MSVFVYLVRKDIVVECVVEYGIRDGFLDL